MVHAQREQRMKTSRIDVGERQVIVGVLRTDRPVPLLEAPFAIKAFNEERRTNIKLIDPRIADRLLAKTDVCKELRRSSISPVNAIIAYEQPGKGFDSEVVFPYTQRRGVTSLTYRKDPFTLVDRSVHYSPYQEGDPRLIIATGKYKGEKDIGLVATGITTADMKRERNDVIITIPEERLVSVPDLPSRNGFFMPHAETTVPHGKEILLFPENTELEGKEMKVRGTDVIIKCDPSFTEVRYFSRRDGANYVGFMGYSRMNSGAQEVNANLNHSGLYEILVEIPEKDFVRIAH